MAVLRLIYSPFLNLIPILVCECAQSGGDMMVSGGGQRTQAFQQITEQHTPIFLSPVLPDYKGE